MPFYEIRANRDGVPLSVQCILVKQCAANNDRDVHYHDYVELLFGLAGTSVVTLENEHYPLSAGSMLLIGDHKLHDVTGNGDPSEYIVVKFLPSILNTSEQNYNEYGYSLSFIQNFDRCKIFFDPKDLAPTQIPSLFYHILSEWKNRKYGYELSMRSDVISIVLAIMRIWQSIDPERLNGHITSSQGVILQNAVAYIEKNYSYMSEQSVADHLGITTSYLSRVFKKCMKTTFASYVTEVRLRVAKAMLVMGDDSITDIALKTGFSNSSYFTCAFRRANGITPGKYRKSFRDERKEGAI